MVSFVEVTRGAYVESRHRIHAVVVAPDGRIVAHTGTAAMVTFWRSASKFFQAAPLVASGGADALGLTAPELAIACASHNGEPRHVEAARLLLSRSGSTEADLHCGAHPSLNEELARAQTARRERLTRLHSNCSGKHAGMLATAAHRGWPKAGYQRPEHPVQQACRAEVLAWTGLADKDLGWATDGCGVPTFALPLQAMALAYARLAAAADGRAFAGAAPADASRTAVGRLVGAVAEDPFLLAGSGRLDSELIALTKGRVIAKVGADGVYSAALRDLAVGVALKVEDGSWRAAGPALLSLLDQLMPGALPELEQWRKRQVLNSNGVPVGEIVGRVKLVKGAPK